MKNKSFIQTMFKYTFISWAAFIISFISAPILTRVYNPSELGSISMFLSVNAILQVVNLCGQDQLLIRRYNESSSPKSDFISYLYIILSFWLLTTTASIFLSSKVSILIYGETNVFAICAAALSSLPLAIIRITEQARKMRNEIKSYGLQILIYNLITKLGVISVGLIDKTYNSYILAYSLVTFITGIVFLAVLLNKMSIKKSNLRIEVKNIINFISFGLPVMISSILFLLKDIIPRIILRSYYDMNIVGIFASAMSLASAINVLQAGFNTYFSAFFFQNYREDNGKFNIIHHTLMFVMSSALIVMSSISFILVNILGNQYNTAGSIFTILSISSVAIVVSETTVHGINLSNNTKIHIGIALLSSLSILIIGVLIIPRLGVLGAAVAYAFGGIIFYILRTFYGQKYFKTINEGSKTIISFAIILGSSIVNYYFYEEKALNMLIQFFLLVVLIFNYKNNLITLYNLNRRKVKE